MALEEINNGGFIGDDSAESVFESFNKVKRNFESLGVSNIAGLVGALDTKENKANKQTDLTSTDPNHYPNVNAVNQALQIAETGFQRFSNVGNVVGSSGRIFSASTTDLEQTVRGYNFFIDLTSSPDEYIFIKKSFQDTFDDDFKLDLIRFEEGVYRLSIHFNENGAGNGGSAVFEIDKKENNNNPYSQSLNDDYYIYKNIISRRLTTPLNFEFVDSDVRSIGTELISVEKDEDIAVLQSDVVVLGEDLASKEVKPISVTNRSKTFGNQTPNPNFNGIYSIGIGHFTSNLLLNDTAIHIVIDNLSSSSCVNFIEIIGWVYANPEHPLSVSKTHPMLELNDQFLTLVDIGDDIGKEFEIPNKDRDNGVVPTYNNDGKIDFSTSAGYEFSMYRVGDHPTRGCISAIKIYNNKFNNPFFASTITVNSHQTLGIPPEILTIVSNDGTNLTINDI